MSVVFSAPISIVSSDEATLLRIRRWEMSVRYLRVGMYFDRFTADELEKEILSFTADMDTLGISQNI